MSTWTRLSLFVATLVLSACGGPAVLPDGTSTLRGEVIYDGERHRAPGAVLELILVDTADPDSRVGPLARERIANPDGPPVPFRIVYNVRSVQSGHAYAVCARAKDAAGSVVWATESLRSVRLPTDEELRVVVTDDSSDWMRCKEWND